MVSHDIARAEAEQPAALHLGAAQDHGRAGSCSPEKLNPGRADQPEVERPFFSRCQSGQQQHPKQGRHGHDAIADTLDSLASPVPPPGRPDAQAAANQGRRCGRNEREAQRGSHGFGQTCHHISPKGVGTQPVKQVGRPQRAAQVLRVGIGQGPRGQSSKGRQGSQGYPCQCAHRTHAMLRSCRRGSINQHTPSTNALSRTNIKPMHSAAPWTTGMSRAISA